MKKKGFTLIELLAVIVILGIIMLVAVPSALNLIGKTKVNLYKNDILTYIDALKLRKVTEGNDSIYLLNKLDVDNDNTYSDSSYIYEYGDYYCIFADSSKGKIGNVNEPYCIKKDEIPNIDVNNIINVNNNSFNSDLGNYTYKNTIQISFNDELKTFVKKDDLGLNEINTLEVGHLVFLKSKSGSCNPFTVVNDYGAGAIVAVKYNLTTPSSGNVKNDEAMHCKSFNNGIKFVGNDNSVKCNDISTITSLIDRFNSLYDVENDFFIIGKDLIDKIPNKDKFNLLNKIYVPLKANIEINYSDYSILNNRNLNDYLLTSVAKTTYKYWLPTFDTCSGYTSDCGLEEMYVIVVTSEDYRIEKLAPTSNARALIGVAIDFDSENSIYTDFSCTDKYERNL